MAFSKIWNKEVGACKILKSYLIIFNNSCSVVVDEYSTVLATPDFVPRNFGIRAGPDLNARIKMVENVVVLQ
jgi:hypothetical protein